MKKIVILLLAALALFGACYNVEKDSIANQVAEDGNLPKLIEQDDCYVMGGDIILLKDDPVHMQMVKEILNADSSRGIRETTAALWPQGKVYYKYQTSLTTAQTAIISRTIRTLEAICGVDYIYDSTKTTYVYKISSVTGQNYGGVSTLGYTSGAYVNIQDWNQGTVTHEFLHGLGISHEHQRYDRLITVDTANIIDDDWIKAQFAAIPNANAYEYGAYDYDSIMHYPAYISSWAKDPSKPIIVSSQEIGQRSHLSTIDKYTLVQLYGNKIVNYEPNINFGASVVWHGWFCIGTEVPEVGDFNNDGKDDIITFDFAGNRVWVALSTGSAFGTASVWNSNFTNNTAYSVGVGDFNGDGRDDICYFTKGTTGDVYVSLSTGSSFGAKTLWHSSFCYGTEVPLIGNFNGDSRDDIACFTRSTTGDVYVATSNGSSFVGTASAWHTDFCYNSEVPRVADVNGDGRDDILAFSRSTYGDVFVGLSSGSAFKGTALAYHLDFCYGTEIPLVGDFNNDGFDDIVSFARGTTGDVFGAISSGYYFVGTADLWHDWFCIGSEVPLVGDFNGDGNADLVTFLKDTRTDAGRGDVIVGLN